MSSICYACEQPIIICYCAEIKRLREELDKYKAALEKIVDDPGFPIKGNEAAIALRMNLIAHKALGLGEKE